MVSVTQHRDLKVGPVVWDLDFTQGPKRAIAPLQLQEMTQAHVSSLRQEVGVCWRAWSLSTGTACIHRETLVSTGWVEHCLPSQLTDRGCNHAFVHCRTKDREPVGSSLRA